MNAFHSLRTREKTFPADFELFTQILSALEWQKHNGEIKFVTDERGAEFIKNLGIEEIYSEVEVALDEFGKLNIDEKVFWAGAKLLALSKQNCPCVMMDLDFIVWRPIDFKIFGGNLAVIHREVIDFSIYPPQNFFKFKNAWKLPDRLDWTVEPCNGAFVYFADRNFVQNYCDFAFEFMQNADTQDDRLCYMVFAEQRWLAMCAAQLATPIKTFSTLPELFGGRQNYFTHIWGHKQKLRDDKFAAEKFCRDCARRLRYDFPDFAEKLSSQDWAKKYF